MLLSYLNTAQLLLVLFKTPLDLPIDSHRSLLLQFHFSSMMPTIQGFYDHIQSQGKPLQPLSYLLFFFTNEGLVSGFL
jgi:hypothetical protein